MNARYEREYPPKPDSVWINNGLDWLDRKYPKPSFANGLIFIVILCSVCASCLLMFQTSCLHMYQGDVSSGQEQSQSIHVVPGAERPLIEQLEAGEIDEEMSPIGDKNHDSGIVGALPPRDDWMGKFRTARKHKLETHPLCEACGDTAEEAGHLEAHHVISVKRIVEEKLKPELQWDTENLIILCRVHHHDCGHPHGWSESNPNVRRDAARVFEHEWPGWAYAELVTEKTNPTPARGERLRKSTERKTTVAP